MQCPPMSETQLLRNILRRSICCMVILGMPYGCQQDEPALENDKVQTAQAATTATENSKQAEKNESDSSDEKAKASAFPGKKSRDGNKQSSHANTAQIRQTSPAQGTSASAEKGADAVEGKGEASKEARDPLKPPKDVAGPPADVVKAPSGLATKLLKPGKGTRKAKTVDSVQIHFTGWQTTGRMFDSTWKRGEPEIFRLSQVIAGWTEGIQLMVEGEQRRFWIPQSLAYKGRPGAPSGTLVFDIELIKIIEVPLTPDDVSEPPSDADKTESGLVTKILKPGEGMRTPKRLEAVVIHFTGWTATGQMFDSSVATGTPVTVHLNRAIDGWAEGIGLMVEGEKRRLWIPESLAYKGRPGAPAGMLVFDVELLEIKK